MEELVKDLFLRLVSTERDSPEAQAIHEQLVPLLTGPKPYTETDFETDLQKEFDRFGITVLVDRDPRWRNLTVITRKQNHAFAIQVTPELMEGTSVRHIASALLDRWKYEGLIT